MSKSSNHKKYISKNPIMRFLLWNFFRDLLKVLQHPKYDSLLDAGCGEGFVVAKIVKEFPKVKVTGIDLSPQAIEIAKENVKDASFSVGSIYELPYKNSSFELVLCNEVLEHLEHPQKALKELIRVSSRYIALSVPHEPWFRVANVLRGNNVRSLGNHPEHIQHWSARGFVKWLQNHDLEVKRVHIPFFWTIVLCEKK